MAQLAFIQTKDNLVGRIEIGDLCETFTSASSTIGAEEYCLLWRSSLDEISKGKDKMLVTSWSPSTERQGISGRAYVFYWLNPDELAIQESLLINAIHFAPPRPSLATLRITPHQTHDEGDRISEWSATRHDFEQLHASLAHAN